MGFAVPNSGINWRWLSIHAALRRISLYLENCRPQPLNTSWNSPMPSKAMSMSMAAIAGIVELGLRMYKIRL
ncbi:MAG: hypothetical protein ABJA02_09565 [Acidobacteriota bacterium]